MGGAQYAVEEEVEALLKEAKQREAVFAADQRLEALIPRKPAWDMRRDLSPALGQMRERTEEMLEKMIEEGPTATSSSSAAVAAAAATTASIPPDPPAPPAPHVPPAPHFTSLLLSATAAIVVVVVVVRDIM